MDDHALKMEKYLAGNPHERATCFSSLVIDEDSPFLELILATQKRISSLKERRHNDWELHRERNKERTDGLSRLVIELLVLFQNTVGKKDQREREREREREPADTWLFGVFVPWNLVSLIFPEKVCFWNREEQRKGFSSFPTLP